MLGKEIRRARLEKQLSQEQLSLASGVARAYLSELENDQRSVSVEVLVKLSQALDISAGVLLGRAEGLNLVPAKASDDAPPKNTIESPPVAKPGQYLTVREFASATGRTLTQVREWCRMGRLAAQQNEAMRGQKKEWLIARTELARFMKDGLRDREKR